MYERQNKPIRDFLSKILKKTNEAIDDTHGGIGRAANSMASGVESAASKLKPKPKQTYSEADMKAALEIWKKQGMGKIGNTPSNNWVEHPNQKAHHTSMTKKGNAHKIGDHVPNKKKYTDMAKEIGGYNDLQSNSKKFWEAKKNENFVTRRGYTGNEIDTGRDLTAIGAAGAGLGMAIDKAITPEEPKHFMGKEITSQREAQSYWTKKKNGGNK